MTGEVEWTDDPVTSEPVIPGTPQEAPDDPDDGDEPEPGEDAP